MARRELWAVYQGSYLRSATPRKDTADNEARQLDGCSVARFVEVRGEADDCETCEGTGVEPDDGDLLKTCGLCGLKYPYAHEHECDQKVLDAAQEHDCEVNDG